MKSLGFATQNAGKLRELQAMLLPVGMQVMGVPEGVPFHVDEDGATFAHNALKKARALVQLTGAAAMADDSGLEVDALAGAPGVQSARFSGVGGPGQDQANIDKVLRLLNDVPDERRQARFVCVLAYVTPAGDEQTYEGIWQGRIAQAPRGDCGFGYDPIFIPDGGDGRTAAQLSADEKNRMSHRRKAMELFLADIRRDQHLG